MPHRDHSQPPSDSTDKKGKGPRDPPDASPEHHSEKSKCSRVKDPSSPPETGVKGSTKIEYDVYVNDPFAAVMQVVKFGSDLYKKWDAHAGGRDPGLKEERDRLREEKRKLQHELSEGEEKLECFYKRQEEKAAEKEESDKKIKVLGSQLGDMTGKLKVVTKERDETNEKV